MKIFATEEVDNILANMDDWPRLSVGDKFIHLSNKVNDELGSKTVSAKMASIFLDHQVIHELLKYLITMSIFYVQAEIYPAKYTPAVDNGKEQMTGWYISYYKDSCIEVKSKNNFIAHAKRLNRIRNDLAHKLTDVDGDAVEAMYDDFKHEFEMCVKAFNGSRREIFNELYDLSRRLGYNEDKTG